MLTGRTAPLLQRDFSPALRHTSWWERSRWWHRPRFSMRGRFWGDHDRAGRLPSFPTRFSKTPARRPTTSFRPRSSTASPARACCSKTPLLRSPRVLHRVPLSTPGAISSAMPPTRNFTTRGARECRTHRPGQRDAGHPAGRRPPHRSNLQNSPTTPARHFPTSTPRRPRPGSSDTGTTREWLLSSILPGTSAPEVFPVSRNPRSPSGKVCAKPPCT
jgi:hypothetical protein